MCSSDLGGFEAAEKAAEEAGDIDGVMKYFKAMLHGYDEEEAKLFGITKNELIVIREEEKIEDEEEQQLKELEKGLPDGLKKKLEAGIEKDFRDVADYFHSELVKMQQDFWHIRLDHQGTLRFATIFSEKHLPLSIKRLAKEEVKDVRQTFRFEDELKGFVSRLKKAKDDKAREKLVAKINALGKRIAAAMKRELDVDKLLLHAANTVHIHLIHKVNDKLPVKLDSLKKQGFQQIDLSQLEAGQREDAKVINNNVKLLYRLIRWEERKQ